MGARIALSRAEVKKAAGVVKGKFLPERKILERCGRMMG
jgi:hypothetical protein